jgi:hypothetical protein
MDSEHILLDLSWKEKEVTDFRRLAKRCLSPALTLAGRTSALAFGKSCLLSRQTLAIEVALNLQSFT